MTGRRIGLVLAALAVAGAAWWLLAGRGGHQAGEAVDLANLVVPTFSAEAAAGRLAFEDNCEACHGPHATGGDRGPPLVHPIYKPGHHADLSFLLAVRQGVTAHHWGFGNMPAVEGVDEDEVRNIVAYVRALQRANGIE